MILSLVIHNFLRKFEKVTIFGPPTILTLPYDNYGICEWEKGKTREMEIPGKSQMADNSQNWKSHHEKNSSDTRDGRIMQKAY